MRWTLGLLEPQYSPETGAGRSRGFSLLRWNQPTPPNTKVLPAKRRQGQQERIRRLSLCSMKEQHRALPETDSLLWFFKLKILGMETLVLSPFVENHSKDKVSLKSYFYHWGPGGKLVTALNAD